MAAPPFEPGEISAETASFNADLAKRLAEAPTPMDIPIPETRQARAEGRGLFPPAGPLEGSTWREIPGAGGRTARVRLSEPAGTARGVYLHIHGGGWTIGAPDQYDRYNQRIAAETGLAVASVEYRLAPENAWPAAPDDVE
ncbi:MAG: alpha/beta hydrolase, partial [Pseudomonadota bacterium]